VMTKPPPVQLSPIGVHPVGAECGPDTNQ
jgi:hypothetical protein